MPDVTLTIDGKARKLRWTQRSDARLGSLERPPQLRDLGSRNPRRAYYALLAFVWAALEDREAFSEPEALADFLSTDQQGPAWEALRSAFVEAGVLTDEKKAAPSSEKTGSPVGHSPSSSSAPLAPTSTT